MADDAVALRRRLHAAPELAYQETETGALIADRLAAFGYEVSRRVGVTGVVGTLRHGDGTRRLGLRADMDALPIDEATGLPHASRRQGVMHACGHDGHTAILLSAAGQLAERRRFKGTLHVIFQPAEEAGGGARAMIADGLFDRFPVDAVYGLHNWPGLPAGQFGFLDGAAMASVDLVLITIHGRGGHGAKPQAAVDPVVAGASLVMALQSVVARNIDPLEAAVVTVGSIHGGKAPNVIPDSVELRLTVRTFSETVRNHIRERIVVLARGHAEAYGARAEVRCPRGYPVLVNHARETAFARDVARRHFGEERIAPGFRPIMASEDFAYMLQERPGSYLFIGNGDSADLHSPLYDFNDAILADAARYWVALAEDYLNPSPTTGAPA